MDHKSNDIVRLCDEVLSEAQAFLLGKSSPIIHGYIAKVSEVVSSVRQDAIGGRLEPSNGAGWGITRFVGEWAEEHRLYDACAALEIYYKSNF